MSVYLFETWLVKPEHENKHNKIWGEYVNYMNRNPELFHGIKSMKLYKKLPGEGFATYIQVVEFNNLDEKVNLDLLLSKDEESLTFKRRLMLFKDIETTAETLCEPIYEYN